MFESFVPPIATTDFDIFLPVYSKIKKTNFTSLLTDLDYVRDDDYLSGKTKFYSKTGFELEFLTLPNRAMNNVITIPAIGIGAEALPKMAPLLWNYVTVDFHGLLVNVPSPSSYCLQKLLINSERRIDKQEKDIQAIRYVLSFVNASNKYSDEFIESFNSSPKKWKKTILETIKKHKIETPLFDK